MAKYTKKMIVAVGVIAIAASVCVTGCMKEYDKPEYVEAETDETVFVVPLEGDTAQQAKFQSVKYLEERKVSTKRIQITHRWSQEGRMEMTGRWIPAVKVIKVKRSPVTREWTADGTSGTSNKNQAIWIESADSVGFSMGFTATGFIKEEDAATFLYWYPSGSLAQVMDSEVRARVQQATGEVAAKYPLDLLRSKKQEMVDAARLDVTVFFKERGITITTISMFGGMTYENPEIQKAIDKTFIAQQEKEVNKARFEAQQKENERIELEAQATAAKLRLEAKGQADAKVLAAAGEAEALTKLSQAIRDAGPAVFQLRQLEIEKDRVARWDGKYPYYFMGGAAGSPGLMIQVPTPGAATTTQPVARQSHD